MRRIAIIATVIVGLLVAGGTQAMAEPTHAENSIGSTEFGPLTDLVVQRLRVSDAVAAAKFGTDLPIDDPVREQQEIAEVRQQAVVLGIDPDATAQFFQDQINASKIVQRGLFKLWTAYPELAPTTRPDLTVIRGQLDQLTTELLAQLVATNDARRPTLRCDIEVFAAELFVHVDALHRRALTVAMRSVC
jgi:chorismate mutase